MSEYQRCFECGKPMWKCICKEEQKEEPPRSTAMAPRVVAQDYDSTPKHQIQAYINRVRSVSAWKEFDYD